MMTSDVSEDWAMVDDDSTELSDLVSTVMFERELDRELSEAHAAWEDRRELEGGSTSTGFSSFFT